MASKINSTVKALKAKMASKKNMNDAIKLEYEIAFQTNNQRGHVYNQDEILSLYNRRGQHRGASKATHTLNHFGNEFKYIVIKRHQVNGYIDEHAYDDSRATGNQLIDEIMYWCEYADRPEADYLCPMLKWFTSKSDMVNPISETAQRNVVIISQKAEFIGDLEEACDEAERLNEENGFFGQTKEDRYDEMSNFADEQGWRDAIWNGGNSGVIFDYEKGYYKAVFVDYAL